MTNLISNTLIYTFITIFSSTLWGQIPAYSCQTEEGFLTFNEIGKLCYKPMETGIQKPLLVLGDKMLVVRIVDGEYKQVICDFSGNTKITLAENTADSYRILSFSDDEPFLGHADFMETGKSVIFDVNGKKIFESTIEQRCKLIGKGYFAYAKESPEAVSEPDLHWTIQHISGKKFKIDAYSLHFFENNGILPYETAGKVHFLKLNQGNFEKMEIPDVVSINQSLDGAYQESKYQWTYLEKMEGETSVVQIVDNKGKLLPYSFSFARNFKHGISGLTFDKKGIFLDNQLKSYPITIPAIEFQDIGDFQANSAGLVFLITSDNNFVYTQFGKKKLNIDSKKPSFHLSDKFLYVFDDNGLVQYTAKGNKKFLGKYSIQAQTDNGFIIQNIDSKFMGWMNNNGIVVIPTKYDLIDPQDYCIFARLKNELDKQYLRWDIYNYLGKQIGNDVFNTLKAFYLKPLNRSRWVIPD